MIYHIACIVLLLATASGDSIPELKASLNFGELNQLKYKIVQPLVEQYLNDIDLPIDLNIDKKVFPLGKLKLEVKETHLNSITIDWENTIIRPFQQSDDTIYFQLHKLDVSLDAHLYAKLGFLKLVDSRTTITIHNLDLALTIRFDASDSTTSWGFNPVIVDNAVDIKKIKIVFHDSRIPNWAVNTLINAITPFIPGIIHRQIKKTLAPAISSMSQQGPIALTLPLNELQYQIGVSWTAPPKTIYINDLPYMNLQVDLTIKNLSTGKQCPQFDTGDLPDKIIDSLDLEVILGGNLIDQLLWVVIDAGLFDLYVDQRNLENIDLPIGLTTSGIQLIVADFFNAYGDKGMYLHAYGNNPVQNLYIRNGRILGALNLMLEFIVDTDSTNYPQDFSKCTSCVNAFTAEVELAIMATAYNVDLEHIGANAIVVKVVTLNQTGGELTTINAPSVINTINLLVGSLLPGINADLKQGIENPLLGKFGVSGLEVVIGDSYISAGVSLDA